MKLLTIIRPDDWHVHLRDGEYLAMTIPATAQRFARAVVMPNLKPPIADVKLAKSYQQKIIAAIPKGLKFQPLMALYLTDQTTPEQIQAAKQANIIGYKLYPAGTTTHSAAGVTDLKKIYPVIEAMESEDLPLLVHAETTNPKVDVFDREIYFIEKNLAPLVKKFPKLRVVVEHVSTQKAIKWILSVPETIAATITAHHLLLNRNDLLVNGIHPHYYCLPILKTHKDQEALIAAAISGNPKFFLGTDSAPHAQSQKESACGCAGIFTAHAALELYAEIFEQAKALDKLEGFASFFGADFYQLPHNQEKITLKKESWLIPGSLTYGTERLIPFRANESVQWKI